MDCMLAALRILAESGGVATRPEMHDQCGKHFSALNAALIELEALGIVEPIDAARHIGNKGRRYRLLSWPAWAGDQPEALAESVPERMEPKRRRCLSCGEDFASQWCGNRRCASCSAALSSINDRMLGLE
jgi:hypothetical protein